LAIFSDAPNFYDGASPEVQANAAEDVVRRLRDEGWATFVRRSSRSLSDSGSTPLSDAAFDDALDRARAWFPTEFNTGRPRPADLVCIFPAPAQRWLECDPR
jgi:hypothetical protein